MNKLYGSFHDAEDYPSDIVQSMDEIRQLRTVYGNLKNTYYRVRTDIIIFFLSFYFFFNNFTKKQLKNHPSHSRRRSLERQRSYPGHLDYSRNCSRNPAQRK